MPTKGSLSKTVANHHEARKTHCKRGHAFDPRESYKGRKRYCRVCDRQRKPRQSPEANRKWASAIRGQKRAFLWAFKATIGCRDCGEADPVVLELHHLHPEGKQANARRNGRPASDYVRWTVMGWKAILAELEKCDVLCANCHRRRTAREYGWG